MSDMDFDGFFDALKEAEKNTLKANYKELEKENAELKKQIQQMVYKAAQKHRPAYDEQQIKIMGMQDKITKLEKVVNLSKKYVDFRINADDEKTFIPQYEARKIIYAELKKALAELNNNPTRQKQDPPNEKWCVGCSPENCSCCEV